MDFRHIRTITVEKLFGLYDYKLTVDSSISDNVFILYGDNGTGKSTLLKLTYHLLSSEVGQAHKTFLANIPFRFFSIEFNDGTLVAASREDANKDFLGNYYLKYNSGEINLRCYMPCEWNEENHMYHIRFGSSRSLLKDSLYEILEKLNNLNVFYISDNRNEGIREHMEFRHKKAISSNDPVEREMNLLHEWIVSQALESSKKGEEGTSEIYVKILEKLGKNKADERQEMTLGDISKEIDNLEIRAKSYAKMGFIPETDYTKVKEKLNKVKISNRAPAANILMPYIEIQKNRLDALDYLFETVDYFVESLNNYLYKKCVVYTVNKGFEFYQSTGYGDPILNFYHDPIDIKKLSSGERQLLRLFSMVIRKSNVCPIIIIDEPEISLNIKWQRRLLSTLNYFVRKSHAQFLIATHSFEIIASHTEHTVKVGEPYLP